VPTGQVIDASTLAGAFGVNTHLNYPGTAYQNLPAVENALNYLELHRLRDVGGQTFTSAYDVLASQNFQFDFIAPSGANQLDVGVLAARLQAFASNHPGAVVGIEGPNESNNQPVNFNGQMGEAGGVAFQQALFQAAKASAVLAPIPVIGLSLGTDDPAAYAALGDMSGVVDQGNAHIFMTLGREPSLDFGRLLNLAQSVTPGRPIAVTETGYPTDAGEPVGVDEITQAKLTLNLLLDAARSGVASTYLYELVDNGFSTGSGGASFGLFRGDWSPKPVASAIHNLFDLFNTTQPGESRPPAPPDYTLSGLNGASLTVHEIDGTYDLVVWAEPRIWDGVNHVAIAAAPQSVTVTLAQPVAGYAVYDPLAGPGAIQGGGVTDTINLSVTDHPVVIELHAAAWLGTPLNDTLRGADGGDNLIFGNEGADSIVGGNGVNTINGNSGDDVIVGRSLLGDWIRGGQGNDSINAQQSIGHNSINGNLGADIILGGAGGDTLHGGQGDDLVMGGGAADWISGDMGHDTLAGGGGADVFHASNGGTGVVIDFDGAAGDRVQVDYGTHYHLQQEGADLHIILEAPEQGELVLQNVQQSAFSRGWIFGA
jgi:hypothetical protein